MASGHTGNPNGQGYGNYCRQPFGDSTHRQRHRRLKDTRCRLALHQPHQESKRSQGEDNFQQSQAERLKLTCQGSLQGSPFLDQLGDAACLGLVTDGHHHPRPLAKGHEAAGIGHVLALGQRRVFGEGSQPFFHRHRLSREGRFVHLQVAHAYQAQVGRHPVSRAQEHHIPRHQLPRGHPHFLPLPHHRYFRHHRLGQGGNRLLRLGLLDVADESVDHHHRPDYDGVAPGA
jgi:hypothetical protein